MARVLTPLILLVALLAAAMLSDRPRPPADFAFANGSDINTLDPQRMSWMPDLRVGRLLHEGLVKHDVLSQTFDVVPAVAESWAVSDDGLTYTFVFRDDARWSNGERVTPDHFRYSWRRGMLPDLASDYFKLFTYVEGARAFYDWRAEQLGKMGTPDAEFASGSELWAETVRRFDETVAMTALDDRTLEIRLERRVPYFLDVCAFTVLAPVYPPLVEQYEKPDPASGRLLRRPGWTKPGRLVTNGSFMLADWRFKREVRLEANEHYWDRASLAIDSISIPSIPDPNSEVLAYQTGAVDWVSDVTAGYRGDMIADKLAFRAEHADRVAELEAQGLDPFEIDRLLPDDPRKDVHAPSAFGTYFWNFNCNERLPDGRDNPFRDARVRRAFAMVVDKRTIVENVRRLGEPTAGSLIPPGSIGGYTSPAGLPNVGDAATQEEADAIVARARALLAEAGYPDPSAFPITVELVFNKDSGHDLIAQTIAKNWQQHLGIPVSLAQKELKVYRDDLKKKRFITSRAGWYGDYGDPTTFLNLSKTGDGNNDRAYSNPAYDALLEQAAVEPDAQRRLDILAEAERLIVEEDVPMIPIFHYAHVMMFDPQKITGISSHPRMKQYASLVDVLRDGRGPDEPRTMHDGSRNRPPETQASAGGAP